MLICVWLDSIVADFILSEFCIDVPIVFEALIMLCYGMLQGRCSVDDNC